MTGLRQQQRSGWWAVKGLSPHGAWLTHYIWANSDLDAHVGANVRFGLTRMKRARFVRFGPVPKIRIPHCSGFLVNPSLEGVHAG